MAKKRRSFARAANEVISQTKAEQLSPKPLDPEKPKPEPSKKSVETKARPTDDDEKDRKKYIKVPIEFNVREPHRTDHKDGKKKHGSEEALVERRNPDYDGDQDSEHDGESGTSNGDENERKQEDGDKNKKEEGEVVRSFKLILWRSTYLIMFRSWYAEQEWRYLVSKIPEHEIGIEVAALLFPFLFLLCVWDSIAAAHLDLVQMTQIPLFGAFMIVYMMGYPLMLYGYIVRHCYGYYGRTRRSRLAFAGIVLYPLLFLYYCINEIVYRHSRDEAGIYYHQFKRGPDDHPDDYDEDYDYATQDYRAQYPLGHYTFYDVSPVDLNARVEEEERAPLRALSAEERMKIMTMT